MFNKKPSVSFIQWIAKAILHPAPRRRRKKLVERAGELCSELFEPRLNLSAATGLEYPELTETNLPTSMQVNPADDLDFSDDDLIDFGEEAGFGFSDHTASTVDDADWDFEFDVESFDYEEIWFEEADADLIATEAYLEYDAYGAFEEFSIDDVTVFDFSIHRDEVLESDVEPFSYRFEYDEEAHALAGGSDVYEYYNYYVFGDYDYDYDYDYDLLRSYDYLDDQPSLDFDGSSARATAESDFGPEQVESTTKRRLRAPAASIDRASLERIADDSVRPFAFRHANGHDNSGSPGQKHDLIRHARHGAVVTGEVSLIALGEENRISSSARLQGVDAVSPNTFSDKQAESTSGSREAATTPRSATYPPTGVRSAQASRIIDQVFVRSAAANGGRMDASYAHTAELASFQLTPEQWEMQLEFDELGLLSADAESAETVEGATIASISAAGAFTALYGIRAYRSRRHWLRRGGLAFSD